MSPGSPSHRVARAAGLLGLGAMAVHQLRYALAFGPDAPRALHEEGHAYLIGAAPILVAVATASVIAASLVGAFGAGGIQRASGPRRALVYALALLAVFSVQELTEGVLSIGHPDGLAGVFGQGGWIAVPLALLLGGLAALVARLLDSVEEELGTATPLEKLPLASPPSGGSLLATARTPTPLAARTLSFGLARRPPPLLQVP